MWWPLLFILQQRLKLAKRLCTGHQAACFLDVLVVLKRGEEEEVKVVVVKTIEQEAPSSLYSCASLRKLYGIF